MLWVTAVYDDPQGESQPSNFEVNTELPISGIQAIKNPAFPIVYNKHKNGIEIFGIDDITSIRIFRIDGTIIKSVSSLNLHYVDTKGIKKGIYIINITTKGGKNITEKIVI